MKRDKRKILKRIVIVVSIVLVIAIAIIYVFHDALGYLLIRGFVFFGAREAQQRRTYLLVETDHQALLKACRELSREVATGNLKPGQYPIRWHRHPQVSRFPKPILDLAPTYVFIHESGQVILEMLGGLHHLGVYAYPEDYKLPSYAEYGDRELIPGLWYYEEGYKDSPELRKKIDALLQKRK